MITSVNTTPETISLSTNNPTSARISEFRQLQSLGLIAKHGSFFPSVHYPPITMYPPLTAEELFKSYRPPQDGLFDVYAHLPFCHRHCTFCHYPVKLGPQLAEKDRYLDAFDKEMEIYMSYLGIGKIKPRSILVGGGTPTYLTIPQMQRFFAAFANRVDLAKCRQFNYDVDPTTLTGPEGLERLKIMRDYGVNRLTIGVQSFNDTVLKLMNRHHDAKAARESIENSLKCGFQVNIEFIYGFPGQTMDNWAEVVRDAIATDCHEIQLYRLKIDAYGDFQGRIKQFKQDHLLNIPSTETALAMKQLAIDILNAHGYHENLRRVFSKKRGHFSLYAHNQCCELFDEVGFGLTAFSSLGDRFGLNTQSFEEYYRLIKEGKLPLNRGYVRNPMEQARWAVVLPLKNRDVRKSRFQQVTGKALNEVFGAKVELLKKHGLIKEDDRAITLTDMGGFFADEVCHQFHEQNWIPFPREAYAEGPLNPYNN